MTHFNENVQIAAEIIVIEGEGTSETLMSSGVPSIRRAIEKIGISADFFTIVKRDSASLVDVVSQASERVDFVVCVGNPQLLHDVLVEQIDAQLKATGKNTIHGYSVYSCQEEEQSTPVAPMIQDEQGVPSTNAVSSQTKTLGFLLLKTRRRNASPSAPSQVSRYDESAPCLLVPFSDSSSDHFELLENEEFQLELRRFIFEPQREVSKRFQTKRLHAFGINESSVTQILNDLLTQSASPTVRISSRDGIVTLLILAEGATETECEEQVHKISEIIYSEIGWFIFGEDSETFSEIFSRNLRAQARRVGLLDWGTRGELFRVVDSDVLAFGTTFGDDARELYEKLFSDDLFVPEVSPLQDGKTESTLNDASTPNGISASEKLKNTELGNYPGNVDYLVAISPFLRDADSSKSKVNVVFIDLRDPQAPQAFKETCEFEDSGQATDAYICYYALNLLLKRE